MRLLSAEQTPEFARTLVSTDPTPAALTGQAARLQPVVSSHAVLQASQAINTRLSTVQRSTFDLGLDLSTSAPSRLRSSADLGLDLASPQAPSRLRSAAALGLDTTRPESASRLLSSHELALDVDSAEAASRLSSTALGLDVTSPQAASQLRSDAALGLDVASTQRASTITSTAEINTAATSYGSRQLSFSGSGAASTSSASLSGLYTGNNAAADASALSVVLRRDVAAMNSVTPGLVKFDVVNQHGATLFAFDGLLRAGEQVFLGNDIGLTLTFSAGSLTASHSATTTVSKTPTDVNPNATFNHADPNQRPRFDNNAQVSAGSFKVNGSSIAVFANDSINSVLARINSTVPGISASFANDKLVLGSNGFSEDDIVLSGDTSGFLAAVKLAGATAVRGNVRDDLQVLAKTSQFAGVASGSFTINGVAISVDRQTDTLDAIAARIGNAGAGVTARYDAALDRLVLSGTTNSAELIEVGNDSSGFLSAARLQTSNTVRGHRAEDDVALGKLSRFATVDDGSFVIDGQTIAVSRSDTIRAIVARINDSGARVHAAFNAQTNRLDLTTLENTEDQIAIGGDNSGFLAAAGINSANTVRGNLRDDRQLLAKTSQFAGVASGSFRINGVAISVDREADSLESVLARINAAGAGVSAAYDDALDKLVLTAAGNGADPIEVDGDDSGFLAAAGLQTEQTIRGHRAEDQVALAKLAQFATVANGSFLVDGRAIAVDIAADTVASLIGRINASGARVAASYDAQADRISLQTLDPSDDLLAIGSDSSGFLAAAQLDAVNTETGDIRDDLQRLSRTAAFGAVTNGSFDINGRSIDIDVERDSLVAIIDRINSAGAGVTARFDALAGRVELVSHAPGDQLIVVDNDSSGFLAAASLASDNTLRGQLPDDQQLLSRTSAFAGVNSGSFGINGVGIAVDADRDTLQDLIERIHAAGAGVDAAYDASSGRLVITPQVDGTPLVIDADSSGFLAAAGIATGAFHTRFNPDAAFDARGSASPYFDDGLEVRDGSFSVNGVEIAVAADDTVRRVLARISGSAAGVTASLDEASGTVKLARSDGSTAVIELGDDASGFLAAVKLDASALHQTGSGTQAAADAALGRIGEYAAVRAGRITLNGQAIEVDPRSTTLRGLVTAFDGIDGIRASLDDANGRISLAARRLGDSIDISDTSGVLSALGIATGKHSGSPGAARLVETLVRKTTASNAGEVGDRIARAVADINRALPEVASGRVDAVLRSALAIFADAGIDAITLDRSANLSRLQLDRDELAAALGRLAVGPSRPGAAAADALGRLGGPLEAAVAPAAAAPATSTVERPQVRQRLKEVFRPGPVNQTWMLELVRSAALPMASPAASKQAADSYASVAGASKPTMNRQRAGFGIGQSAVPAPPGAASYAARPGPLADGGVARAAAQAGRL
ncbi:beta strand repeat-containing protein [Piscinibacter sakaiensis]|uniref:beta strand repeat-containing protein n=1 Tax=Piscinibacter sakaiensis TaxID=1547922 RepID=UPI003AADE571